MFKYKAAALPLAIIVLVIFMIVFSSDRYRYPCQDPENWNSPQCNPPLCEASSTCTKYLVDIGETANHESSEEEPQSEDGMTCTARVEKLCTGDECLEIKINDCQPGE